VKEIAQHSGKVNRLILCFRNRTLLFTLLRYRY